MNDLTDIVSDADAEEHSANAIYIRTSDRAQFKGCRRAWHFTSGLRLNMEPKTSPHYFITGRAGHFAFEDYLGHNVYGSPLKALKAFDMANRRKGIQMPASWPDDYSLLEHILGYYEIWIEERPTLQTFWFNGTPQVEVRVQIKLPIKGPNGEDIYYDATFDRVIVDDDGFLWILDYKFTAQFKDLGFLDLNSQITSYCWAAQHIYGIPVIGFIYQEHRKSQVHYPRVLKSGALSTAKNQGTTWKLYKEECINTYGSLKQTPYPNISFLNELASVETTEGDRFIRRTYVDRTPAMLNAEYESILMEVPDMLNNPAIYKNAGDRCSICFLRQICLSMDNNEDWLDMTNKLLIEREERDSWRDALPTSEEVNSVLGSTAST